MVFRRLLLAAALLTLALPGTAGAAGLAGWHAAAPLPTPLQDATATTLANGDVLVVGGRPGDGSTAFLYDPAKDAWSRTGSLQTGRYGHTATPLDDGARVLVAGGISPATGAYVAPAEVYDMDSGQWSPAGSLRAPRAFHTATLLDGRVLVAGGEGGAPGKTVFPTTTELYDPVKNGWGAGGTAGGRDHAAAALAGDAVLVAGGDAGGDAFRDSVLSTDWTQGIAMPAPRTRATATTLSDGTVLLAGGAATAATTGAGLASAAVFDPAAGKWTATGALRAGRLGQTATALADGDVLIAGGLDGGAPVAGSELFHAGRFSPAGDLVVPRADHVAARLDGDGVLVAGGALGDKPLDAVERWTAPTTLTVPGSLAFGSRAVGSATQATLTLTNTGPAPLLTAQAAIAGPNAADFALVGDTCAATGPGAACTLTLRFTPHAGGPRAATLTFADNSAAGSETVALGGTGLPVVGFSLASPGGAFVGASATVAATVTEGGAPVAGRTVTFAVTGPNARTATALTDASGRATLSYSGAAAGADSIAASYVDTAGGGHGAGPVTLTWRVAAIALTPVASTGPMGSSATLTATVTEGGAPVAGRAVAFRVTAGPSQGRTATATTGAAGTATFALSSPAAGTDTVVASFADSGGTTRTATAARTWSDIAALLSLGPETGVAPAGATQSVTATLTEGGVPQAGRGVAFAITAGPDAGRTGSAVTGPDGRATFSFAGAAAGTDTVSATAVDSAGRPLTANAVTRTWTAVVADPCGPGQPDRDGDGIPDACDTALPPGNRPVVAGSVARVQLVSGQVFVKLPGSALADGAPAGFVPLKGVATIPMGSVVDARQGTLALTTAAAYRGPSTQSVRLSAAIFAVRQAGAKQGPHKGIPRGRPYADLVMQTPAGAASACGHGPGKGVVRTLSGAGAGFFRTVGAASTAIVAGTATWSVADRCDGTLTSVGRGRVRVLDLHTHRTRTVRAGQAFLVRARLFAARQR